MKIVNLTNRGNTDGHTALGVVSSPIIDHPIWSEFRNYRVPAQNKLRALADKFAEFALTAQANDRGISYAWIDPPNYFARYLEDALYSAGITPLYAIHRPDGEFIGFCRG